VAAKATVNWNNTIEHLEMLDNKAASVGSLITMIFSFYAEYS
jgi:hypothetical protein